MSAGLRRRTRSLVWAQPLHGLRGEPRAKVVETWGLALMTRKAVKELRGAGTAGAIPCITQDRSLVAELGEEALPIFLVAAVGLF